ncbi:MAG: hypothetical protein JWP15_1567 [Alphaproteobacteria bacterium]|nr:hypothetical protein [Alphaproteobacteria bacterium]
MQRTPTKLYFDGGSRPNPGPIETAVVVSGISHVRTGLEAGDSNRAEWLALIHAAEIAIHLGLDDVVFVGDSALVIHQAKGEWKCRGEGFQALLARFRALAEQLPTVKLRQVKRSQNLAGIALERLHGGLGVARAPEAVAPDFRSVQNRLDIRR